jgi:hypothetical protein
MSSSLISGLLNQEITTISSTTKDGYGRATKTTVYSDVKCRWQEGFQEVLDKNGAQVLAKIEVWLPDRIDDELVTIAIDYIFLYNSVEYKVITFSNHYDISGTREFVKVYLR